MSSDRSSKMSPTGSGHTASFGRTITLAFMATVPVLFITFLILKYHVRTTPLFGPDIVFELAAVLGLLGAMSLSLPKATRMPKPESSVLRSAAYEAIGIWGFILGIAGADWVVFVPFFAVGFGGLIYSLVALRIERRR